MNVGTYADGGHSTTFELWEPFSLCVGRGFCTETWRFLTSLSVQASGP